MNTKPILILEDNDIDYDTISVTLRQQGFVNPLFRATDGEGCLELLQRSVAANMQVEASIVLLDLNTPGLDGRDVLAELRSHPSMARLPVVILTSSANPSDIEYCYQAGANAFHRKPLDIVDFRGLVREIATYWLNCAVLPGDRGMRM